MHTVFVMPRDDEAMAMVCLFGEWLYGSPLDGEFKEDMPAWVVDPHARTFRKTDWDGLLLDAAEPCRAAAGRRPRERIDEAASVEMEQAGKPEWASPRADSCGYEDDRRRSPPRLRYKFWARRSP